jgi:hypothetical protein
LIPITKLVEENIFGLNQNKEKSHRNSLIEGLF